MKKGDKVLCKKNFYGTTGFLYYKENEWYTIIATWFDFGQSTRCFTIDSLNPTHDKTFFERRIYPLNHFDTHFYSIQESRLQKLKKLSQ